MCNPVAYAILASSAVGAGVSKHQGDKQREQMEKQAAEAKAERERQKAQFELDKQKAEAVPTLLRNQAQKTKAKGIQGMKIPQGVGGSGYSSIGTGGVQPTGLNIPKG